MHPLLLALREYESALILEELARDSNGVLEVGAGSGWQAARVAAAGHDVIALDISPAPPPEFFPVQVYDGVHIPLATASVDIVYSSNCLEHVRDLPALLAEMRRVLRPGGRGVHVLPTPSWRFWTILTYYVWLTLVVLRLRSLPPGRGLAPRPGPASRAPAAFVRILQLALASVVEPPHGEFPSALSEIREYGAKRWDCRFARSGWTVTRRYPTRLFYTGYGVAGRLSIEWRRKLSRFLGSSCIVYIVEPVALS